MGANETAKNGLFVKKLGQIYLKSNFKRGQTETTEGRPVQLSEFFCQVAKSG
jgi:hypothetical protein